MTFKKEQEDPIAELAAAYSRQGEILECLLERTRCCGDTGHETVVVKDERTVSQLETPEQQAIVAHYEQLRSQLGRPGAQMAVWVKRLDRGGLELVGEPACNAQMIEVGPEQTCVGREWRRNDAHPRTLTWRGEGAEHVPHGTHVRLYAGQALVGIGYWQPETAEREMTKGR